MVILVFFGLVRGRSLSLGLGHVVLPGFLFLRFSEFYTIFFDLELRLPVDVYLPYSRINDPNLQLRNLKRYCYCLGWVS